MDALVGISWEEGKIAAGCLVTGARPLSSAAPLPGPPFIATLMDQTPLPHN